MNTNEPPKLKIAKGKGKGRKTSRRKTPPISIEQKQKVSIISALTFTIITYVMRETAAKLNETLRNSNGRQSRDILSAVLIDRSLARALCIPALYASAISGIEQLSLADQIIKMVQLQARILFNLSKSMNIHAGLLELPVTIVQDSIRSLITDKASESIRLELNRIANLPPESLLHGTFSASTLETLNSLKDIDGSELENPIKGIITADETKEQNSSSLIRAAMFLELPTLGSAAEVYLQSVKESESFEDYKHVVTTRTMANSMLLMQCKLASLDPEATKEENAKNVYDFVIKKYASVTVMYSDTFLPKEVIEGERQPSDEELDFSVNKSCESMVDSAFQLTDGIKVQDKDKKEESLSDTLFKSTFGEDWKKEFRKDVLASSTSIFEKTNRFKHITPKEESKEKKEHVTYDTEPKEKAATEEE